MMVYMSLWYITLSLDCEVFYSGTYMYVHVHVHQDTCMHTSWTRVYTYIVYHYMYNACIPMYNHNWLGKDKVKLVLYLDQTSGVGILSLERSYFASPV